MYVDGCTSRILVCNLRSLPRVPTKVCQLTCGALRSRVYVDGNASPISGCNLRSFKGGALNNSVRFPTIVCPINRHRRQQQTDLGAERRSQSAGMEREGRVSVILP
jgi:hypothetical protein